MNSQNNDNNQKMHAIIEGRVQGVGFRYFVFNQARELNLVGWVRNTHQGQVEVTAEGSRDKLEMLLFALRKGPSSSFVQDVHFDFEPVPDGVKFDQFDILSTI